MTTIPPAPRPEFPQTLTNLTGLEKRKGETSPSLIHASVTGDLLFLNSGVGLFDSLPAQRFRETPKTVYQSVGAFATNYFRQGQKLTFIRAYLCPEDTEPAHFHPGGEIAMVRAGEYFDADLEGTVIRSYLQGSVIFYPKGSIHRPLTRDGALVEYITFDGLVKGKDPEDLLTKMRGNSKIPEEALEYALLWMVTDPSQRESLRLRLGML